MAFNAAIGTLSVKISADTSDVRRGIKSTNKDLSKSDKALEKNKQQWKKWGLAAKVALAGVAILTARSVVKLSDSFASVQNQIRQTTTSTEELTKRTEDLLQVANRSRSEFAATSELYTQLTLNTEDLGFSTEKLLRITETISKSFSVSGKGAAENSRAIRQLNQAFGRGVLRGDEFISVAEGAPEIFRALKKSLGLTSGELQQFANDGKITTEVLTKAIDELSETIDTKLANATKTLAQSFQEAENNATAFIGSSKLISASMEDAGEIVIALSKNLDVLGNVILIAAAIGFTKLSVATIANTIETVKNNVAKITSVPVTKAVNTGINFTTRSVVAQTAAMRASTVAAAGLKTAMAFIGGPVGVAILAGLAILAYSDDSETATETSRRLAKEVDTLTQSFIGLTRAQIDVKLRNATVEANQLEAEVLAASLRLQQLENFKGTQLRGAVEAQKEKVNELEAALEAAVIKRDALFGAGLDVGRTPETGEEDTELKDLADKDELKRQQANDAFAKRFQDKLDQTAKEKAQRQEAAEDELVDFQKQTANMSELENILHQEDLARAQEAFNELKTSKMDQDAIIEDLERQHKQRLNDIEFAENEAKRQIFERDANSLLSSIAVFGKNSLKIQKAISLAQAAVAISTGIARAQELGWPQNLVEMARVAAVGVSAIRSIKGAKVGSASVSSAGSGGGGGSRGGGAAPTQQAPSAQQAPRSIDVNFVGQGVLSMDQTRTLIEQMREAFGDGVTEFNVVGG